MDARVIAAGRSKVTGQAFNIAVAFADGPAGGRAIAQSRFHHFADYNWDIRAGSPSFVSELPSTGLIKNPQAVAGTRRYVLNLARWLGARADYAAAIPKRRRIVSASALPAAETEKTTAM
jgi:hypothetical protein